MSRIGNLPVDIPANVTVTINKGENCHTVVAKGPLGELQQNVALCVTMNVEDNKIFFSTNDTPTSLDKSAMHGLYRMLVNNMVIGVSAGFTKTLELIGVGYKAAVINDNVLDLDLGFSHKVYFVLPEGIKAEVKAEKGKSIQVSVKGCDKQLVGLVAAKIRQLRKVEPYKGKGFRYQNEFVKLKAGKTATK